MSRLFSVRIHHYPPPGLKIYCDVLPCLKGTEYSERAIDLGAKVLSATPQKNKLIYFIQKYRIFEFSEEAIDLRRVSENDFTLPHAQKEVKLVPISYGNKEFSEEEIIDQGTVSQTIVHLPTEKSKVIHFK